MIHKRKFDEAQQLMDSGKDWKEADLHVHTICGHTGEGEAPDRRPFFGAKIKAFNEFP